MITKTISHGVKILKFSTLASAVIGLLLFILISFFAIFPSTLKDTLQEQISTHSGLDARLSSISFSFKDGGLALELDKVDIFSSEQSTSIATINNMKWSINLSTLYNNVDLVDILFNFDLTSVVENAYKPSEVYIDTVEVHQSGSYDREVFGAKDIKRLFSSKSLKIVYFIKSLSIDKIILVGRDNLEFNNVKINRDDYQISLNIVGQDFSFNSLYPELDAVDITATLSTKQADIDNYLTLPITLSSDELTLYGNFKIISNKDDDFFEFEGYLPSMEANQLHRYIPGEYLTERNYDWLKDALISGQLNGSNLKFKSDFSGTDSSQVRLTTKLDNVELLYNSTLDPLKQLNATLKTDFVGMGIEIDNAKLADINVSGGDIIISNIDKLDSTIEITGNFNSQSEEVVKFVRKMKISDQVKKALDKFTLSGSVSGTTTLTLPVKGGVEELEFNLNVADNKLTTLGGDIVVEQFNSEIHYKDKKIEANGDGKVKNLGTINMEIPRSEFNKINLDIVANIDSQSEEVVKFVRKMKISDQVKKALDKFTLSGSVSGTTTLTLPVKGGVEELEFNLNVADNKLTTLGGDIVVEQFNSEIHYKDKKIEANGDGKVKNLGTINMEIPRSEFNKINLDIVANIDSQSEEVVKFVRKMKISDQVKKALDKFTLSGSVSGTTTLTLPVKGGVEELEFNLNVADNKLTTLGGDIVVEQFNSEIHYKDKKIEANGDGKVKNLGTINMEIPRSEFNKINLDIVANIDSQSEEVVKFVRKMKISDQVKKALDKFTLSGSVSGTTTLTLPVKGGVEELEFNLNVADNKLTTLGGDIVVEQFNSEIHYKDKEKSFSTNGEGFIRGMHFDVMLNPPDLYVEEGFTFKVKLVNKINGAELHVWEYQDGVWIVRIDSNSISADIVINLNNNETPYVEVSNINITSLDSFSGDWNVRPNEIPSIRLAVQGITVDDQPDYFPRFIVDLEAQNDVLVINNLVFDGIGVSQESLSFNGAWYPGGRTSIMAKAHGDKLSDFLTKLNIKEKVNGGEFDFDIRLYCDCEPWNINYEDIKGVVKLYVREGVFTDKDPSIGRVLSLMNIQTLAKRLELDITDVIQKGFTYEDIDAMLIIENSFARIIKFDLNATSSKIQLSGESDIVNKLYYLDAQVFPSISDAVPAATFLAGGGLMGLGLWLVDKNIFDGEFIDFFVDKVIEFKYKITGPWDEPFIQLQ